MSVFLLLDLLQVLLIFKGLLLLVGLPLLASLFASLVALDGSLASVLLPLFLHFFALHHFLHNLVVSLLQLFFPI